MRLPSPDAFLIGLFERAFAGPQLRGVPLPTLLVATEYGPAATAALCALVSTAGGNWGITAAWGALCVGFAGYGYISSRELHTHARGWNEALIRSYRAEATAMRTMLGPLRAVFLLGVLGAGTAAAMTVASLGPSSYLALVLASLAFQVASFLAMHLARCVMPLEPDVRSLGPARVSAATQVP